MTKQTKPLKFHRKTQPNKRVKLYRELFIPTVRLNNNKDRKMISENKQAQK